MEDFLKFLDIIIWPWVVYAITHAFIEGFQDLLKQVRVEEEDE